MQTHASAFRKILEGLINEEIERETDIISSGSATDFADYKSKAGRIDGMKRVMEFCDAAEKTLAER